MSTTQRVTVTLPGDILGEMDRMEKNRSRFVLEAVRHELERRRRAELRRSLASPHPESEEISETGFDDWASRVAEEDASDLLDRASGKPVRWVPGKGWEENGG